MSGEIILTWPIEEAIGKTVAMLKRSVASHLAMDVWNFQLLAGHDILDRHEYLHDVLKRSHFCEISMLANGPPIEEDVQRLSLDEKIFDILMSARVCRTLHTKDFFGHVEDIVLGTTSQQRLYLIRYSDGDVEHLTAEQVEEMLFTELAEHFHEVHCCDINHDPLIGSTVHKFFDDVKLSGFINTVGVGIISKQRLYRVEYSNGHTEYLIAEQVEQLKVT
eukprot:12431452-Karenia_brevis.AAC.6